MECVNGSARENQVVINCSNTAGGIGFFNVTDFVLSGITLVSCGVSGADIAKELSNNVYYSDTSAISGEPDGVILFCTTFV